MFDVNFSCVAVCEVIYRPNEFVSSTPHWVINQLDWVVTRYLCVQTKAGDGSPPSGYPSKRGCGPSVLASSLRIKTGALGAASSSTHIRDGSTGATGSNLGDLAQSAADDKAPQINGLCQMFPQFEASMVKSVLLSVNGIIDEAVLVLSSMAASVPSGNSTHKRPRDTTNAEVVDLTDPEIDNELPQATTSSAPATTAPTTGRGEKKEPATRLVDEVVSGAGAMGLQLERSDAIRLLQKHHCHVSDALAAAFG